MTYKVKEFGESYKEPFVYWYKNEKDETIFLNDDSLISLFWLYWIICENAERNDNDDFIIFSFNGVEIIEE